MSTEIAAWNERASAIKVGQDFDEKLRLVEDVAESNAAPEHLKPVARRAATSLKRFIKGGMRSDSDRHLANAHFKSFILELPASPTPPVA